MQHLKEFILSIQTFQLNLTEEKQGDQLQYLYDLRHETPYYTSFTLKSELRLLKDRAYLDVLAFNAERIPDLLLHLKSVNERFKQFWVNYHHHYREYSIKQIFAKWKHLHLTSCPRR